MKKLFGILILTLAIVLAVGATSFAAEKTLVDNFTDSSVYLKVENGEITTKTNWELDDNQGLQGTAPAGKILTVTYKVEGAIGSFNVKAVYTDTDSTTSIQYADELVFYASKDGEVWETITADKIVQDTTSSYSGRPMQIHTFKNEDVGGVYKYLKISYPATATEFNNRWYIVFDSVAINYIDIYTFTDNLEDASEVELTDAAKADFGRTGDNGRAWGFVDGYGVIPKKVGNRPELTYCMNDSIVGFELDTILRTLHSGTATDFVFKCSADGLVWDDVSATYVQGDKVVNTTAEIYKYVFSATNISAEKNYKYLRITFPDNEAVVSSKGDAYRDAAALDTVKVICALGESTLTMADGESGTIYCSESTYSSKVTATIVAKDTASKSAIAILATYDNTNKLVNVKTKDFSFNTTEDLSCERLILPAANSAKLMVLNSLGALVPMTVVNPIQ